MVVSKGQSSQLMARQALPVMITLTSRPAMAAGGQHCATQQNLGHHLAFRRWLKWPRTSPNHPVASAGPVQRPVLLSAPGQTGGANQSFPDWLKWPQRLSSLPLARLVRIVPKGEQTGEVYRPRTHDQRHEDGQGAISL